MYFHSIKELLAMNGHGPYVWSAYLISYAVILILVWAPLFKKKKLIQRAKRELALAERRKEKVDAPST